MRSRSGVVGFLTAAIFLALIPAGNASARGPAPLLNQATVSASPSLAAGPLEKVQMRVVRDRERAKRGKLRLGGLSDGFFDIRIVFARGKVVILMPPLRAKQLRQTRRLAAKRYGDAPIEVRLARLVKPQLGTSRVAITPRRGKPLYCPPSVAGIPGGDWNAKRIIGRPLAQAENMARGQGCVVRVVLIDGMGVAGTADLSHLRINVVVRAGKVTRILGLS